LSTGASTGRQGPHKDRRLQRVCGNRKGLQLGLRLLLETRNSILQQNCHLDRRSHGPAAPPKQIKNASVQQRLSMEPLPFPLSSRAKPRDLQFRGPVLEMFFDRAYPDFLPRKTRNMDRQRQLIRQEIRGSVVERSAVSFLGFSRPLKAPALFCHPQLLSSWAKIRRTRQRESCEVIPLARATPLNDRAYLLLPGLVTNICLPK
jgi:hypothetical protein